ncbi:MAG: hypothetical protein MMC33_000608 [Icmadophila ericetorum]|nr:hypothetical protein [Icmadophila ericetorum]
MLQDGEYWCPYCQHSERLTTSKATKSTPRSASHKFFGSTVFGKAKALRRLGKASCPSSQFQENPYIVEKLPEIPELPDHEITQLESPTNPYRPELESPTRCPFMDLEISVPELSCNFPHEESCELPVTYLAELSAERASTFLPLGEPLGPHINYDNFASSQIQNANPEGFVSDDLAMDLNGQSYCVAKSSSLAEMPFRGIIATEAQHLGPETPPSTQLQAMGAFPSYLGLSSFANTVQSQIIEPLNDYDGLEAFRPVANRAGGALQMQILDNIHDVEIYLRQEGLRYSKSHDLYRTYARAVSGLCAKVASDFDRPPISRDEHYLRIVDSIEHLTHLPPLGPNEIGATGTRLEDLDLRYQQKSIPPVPKFDSSDITNTTNSAPTGQFGNINLLVASSPPKALTEYRLALSQSRSCETDEDIPRGLKRPHHDVTDTYDDIRGIATSQSNSSYSPQSSVMSFSPSQSSPMSFSSSQSSSMSFSSSQSSAMSFPADEALGILNCKICGQEFKGKRKHIPSNLQRHKRETHPENGVKQSHKCSAENCSKESTRLSNMRAHEKTHNTPKPSRSSSVKRIKSD